MSITVHVDRENKFFLFKTLIWRLFSDVFFFIRKKKNLQKNDQIQDAESGSGMDVEISVETAMETDNISNQKEKINL